MEERRRPELAGAALAALTFAAALACGRLLVGRAWVWPSLVAACSPHVIGLLCRRRGWKPVVTLAISVGGLALFCAWRFAGDTTILGIPTPDTFSLLWEELGAGLRAMRQEVAPVAVSTDVLLLVVIGTWIAGLLADHLAFERDATAGALMPPLVLVVVAASIGDRIDPGATALVFASAAAAFLLLRNDTLLRRRRRWVRAGGRPSTLGTLRAGALVGALAVFVGVVLGPHLPGAGGGPVVDSWFDGDGSVQGDSGYVTISPIVTIRKSLLEKNPRELFRVQSGVRAYWRVAGLDRFDGKTWSLKSRQADFLQAAPLVYAVGPARQRFEIGEMGERFLPAAFQGTVVSGTPFSSDRSTDTLIVQDRKDVSGLVYEVQSYLQPDANSLPPDLLADTDQPVPANLGLERFLDLPDTLPDRVRQIAENQTRAATNPYAKAQALERYFRTRFSYSLTTAPAGAGEDDMLEFLDSRVGYCEQFAGTFATMARALGIPARVAVGFTPGTQDPATGAYRVTTSNAHAWPEVYLAGLGWWAFEPTPSAGTSAGAAGGSVSVARPGIEVNEIGEPQPAPELFPPDPSTEPGIAVESGGGDIEATGDDGGNGGIDLDRFVVPAIVVLAVGAVLAYVIGVPLAKRRRRHRRRAEPDPRRAVAGAWAEAVERLEEAGVTRRPAATPREVAAAVGGRGMAHVSPALRDLAEEWTVAAYGVDPPSPEDVQAAWRSFEDLERALDEDLGRTERLRRLLDPAPLLRR